MLWQPWCVQKILLLDEHTAALDPKTSDMVMNLTRKIVEEQELTTLMITHNMEHAIEYGNRLSHALSRKNRRRCAGEERKTLTVAELMDLFHKIVDKSSMTMPWCSVNKQKKKLSKVQIFG